MDNLTSMKNCPGVCVGGGCKVTSFECGVKLDTSEISIL